MIKLIITDCPFEESRTVLNGKKALSAIKSIDEEFFVHLYKVLSNAKKPDLLLEISALDYPEVKAFCV